MTTEAQRKYNTEWRRKWNNAHRSEVNRKGRASGSKWRAANPKKARDQWIKGEYNIPAEEYDRRLALQNNLCALCHKPFAKGLGKEPCLDHNHDTHKLRAFIHKRCNSALGLFHDSVETCLLAAEYLKQFS